MDVIEMMEDKADSDASDSDSLSSSEWSYDENSDISDSEMDVFWQ